MFEVAHTLPGDRKAIQQWINRDLEQNHLPLRWVVILAVVHDRRLDRVL
jgi:hypothetical protein